MHKQFRALAVVSQVVWLLTLGCGSDDPRNGHSAPASTDGSSTNGAKGTGFRPVELPEVRKDDDAGSEPAADRGKPESHLDAFRKLAGAYCDKLVQCAPFGFERSYESGDECRKRRMLMYSAWAELPDTGWTADNIEACYEAVYSLSCREFIDDNGQKACAPKGKRKDGEPCNTREQCGSRYCDAEGYACGTCKKSPKEGASCREDNDCPDESTCLCDNGTPRCDKPRCRRLRDAQEACSATQPCGSGLNCVRERCEPAPDRPGESCNPAEGRHCDTVSAGLACIQGTCTPLQAADTCSPSEYCKDRNTGCQIDPDKKQAACVPVPEDGEPCNPKVGLNCRFPAVCSQGKCQLPGAAPLCAVK